MLKVKDIMVKEVVTIQSDQTIQAAVKIMNENRIGSLVVLENGIVTGMVTERDMLERVIAVSVDPVKTLVWQVMSTPVVTIEPETMVEEAVELMFEHKIKKLPVVEVDGQLVGLVTLTDIARIYPALMSTLRKHFEGRCEAPPKQMEKVMNFYIV